MIEGLGFALLGAAVVLATGAIVLVHLAMRQYAIDEKAEDDARHDDRRTTREEDYF